MRACASRASGTARRAIAIVVKARKTRTLTLVVMSSHKKASDVFSQRCCCRHHNETRVVMTLVGLRAAGDQLRLAREFAVLGDYDTSRVYYQGVLSQVSRYARGPSARPAVGTLARASDARAARPPARVLTRPDPPPRSRPADTSTPWTGTKTRPTRTARYVFPHPRTPRVFEIRASSSRRPAKSLIEKSLLETKRASRSLDSQRKPKTAAFSSARRASGTACARS